MRKARGWRAGFSRPVDERQALASPGSERRFANAGASFRRAVPSRRGQALVEFAIAALITLLLVLSVVEFSRIMLVYTTLADAARLGARYAITHGTVPGGAAVTCGSGVAPVVKKFLAPGTVNINASGLSITTACPAGTTPGNPVQVTVSYPYNYALLSYAPLNVTLSTTSEGIITW
jgi:Flp pilus assembly protein TadG